MKARLKIAAQLLPQLIRAIPGAPDDVVTRRALELADKLLEAELETRPAPAALDPPDRDPPVGGVGA